MRKRQYKKRWYKFFRSRLTAEAREAKLLVLKICVALTNRFNEKFYVEMGLDRHCYEGHIIVNSKNDECNGMIFWGGYFSRKKHKDAESKAWISLLEDCIGIGEDSKIHNLTKYVEECYGNSIDFNCSSKEELYLKLAVLGID